jgi:hypothetical protein
METGASDQWKAAIELRHQLGAIETVAPSPASPAR